ncbi:Scr1 family TA system antitoxin-like transcriptional regulator [Saccharopolyspora sp. NPDC000995]
MGGNRRPNDHSRPRPRNSGHQTGWWNTYAPDAIREDFEDYLEVEEVATRLQTFEIHLVPGLLQTAKYYSPKDLRELTWCSAASGAQHWK